MFKLSPGLSKNYILNNITEEDIFEHYLGIHVSHKSIKNPLRADKSASASFYRGKGGRLKFIDYTGFCNCDCFELVMLMFNISFNDSLRKIANDFGLMKFDIPKTEAKIQYSHGKVSETTTAKIQGEIKAFTDEEINWWSRFHITKETLSKFRVFSIKTVFLNNSRYCVSTPQSPVYGYYFGKSEGLELWKMYCPTRTRNRFLGNSRGLQGEHMLPINGELLVITKSLKDVMCFYELGIPAVAPHSEGIILSDEDFEMLSKRFKHLVVVYDGDRAGIHGMWKFKKKYNCLCIPCSVKPKVEAKDISDCIAKYGFEFVKNKVNEIKNKVINGKT